MGRRRSASDLCSRHGNFHAHCVRLALAGLACFGAMILAARAETFEQRLAPCLACHGEQGQSSLPELPSLGAQPAPYLLIQLYLFRGRQRLVPRTVPPIRHGSIAPRRWCASTAATSVTARTWPDATTFRVWRGNARTT